MRRALEETMTPNVWTTSAYAAPARFDAWRHALNSSHLEWDLEPAPEGPFGARIRQRTLDGVRVVECHCDPCTGWRRRPQLRRSEGAYFGILFELRGQEVIRQSDNEAVLRVGDFVMWDSECEMEFRVLEPLHKLTLLIPKARLKALLGDAEQYAGMVVSSSRKTDGIAGESLRRLAREFLAIEEAETSAVLDPILSLLSATLMTRRPPLKASRGHQDSFRNFCHTIERNLSESGLTPAAVAAAHGVSLRYLHLVFAEQGTTFGKLLRRTRLARCHRELSQSLPGKTITQIAFRWGFNDMAHFSRSFKAEFGSSPRVVSQGTERLPGQD